MKKYEILIIDDDKNLCRLLKDRIELDKRFTVFTAHTGTNGLALMEKKNISVVFLDLQLPDENGTEILQKIKNTDPDITVIMITAFGSIDLAVQSLQMGASHFLTKPFPFEQSIQLIDRFIKEQELVRERRLYKEETSIYQFVGGKSPVTRKLLQMVEQVAPTSSTVLISGASGTGKELIARMIYQKSQRADKPFVKIDCTVLSSNILESDLFGHEKGAFTSATYLKKGRLELADGGTVFFDEIGDLPMELQAKLLRIIQHGEFERVGGVKTLNTNIRVIAATNRNLKQYVQEGKFREDLFYRLNVINLEIPSLKERIEDLPDLVDHFIDKYNSELKKNVTGVDPEVLHWFRKYSWPGNVRELENLIERGMVFADGHVLGKDLFPTNLRQALPSRPTADVQNYKQAIANFKRSFLIDQLHQVNGDVTRMAKNVDLPRTYLYQLFKELQIDLKEFKS